MSAENISWTAGEVIYKTGDESDFAYLLTKGEVEIISEKGPINNEIGVQFGRYYTMPTRKAKTGAAAVGAGTAAASAGYFGLDYYRKRGRR